jgi:hypothetical protein
MLNDLIKLADDLDKAGLHREASFVDRMIKQSAYPGEVTDWDGAVLEIAKIYMEKNPPPRQFGGFPAGLTGMMMQLGLDVGETGESGVDAKRVQCVYNKDMCK